jgi:glyoxylase-like metal-dependent hydrolase (beta-lactamase superfamily II)
VIPFVREFDFAYGRADRLSPLVTRVIAENPGPFTFTGTGTYLIGDKGGVAVIDPGPDDPQHREAVLRAAPGPILSILVTHTHRDHSAGVPALKAASGADVLAFGAHPSAPDAASPALEEGADFAFRPDRRLRGGEVIALPACRLTAIHTPGHIGNHLCFALEEEQALFTGDHVMGWATTVVAPPDGSMRDYLASLALLKSREDKRYYPTHGAPIEAPLAFVEAIEAHRAARDAAILEALRGGEATPAGIAARVYQGLEPALLPAAALNVTAHLLMHEERGTVLASGEGRYALA